MDCFPGSRCFSCLGKFLRFYFSYRKIPPSLKIDANKKTSSIICSYCHRRSVPVGVHTLRTIQKFIKYTQRGKAFNENHHCLCKITFKYRLKLFFQTGKTYRLQMNKSSQDVPLIYFIWWIQSPTVVQYLLTNTVPNVFHT